MSDSVLPSSHLDEVAFEISPEADGTIRHGGGELWVWATDDGWPYGTTEPPSAHSAEWWTYEREGILVHVDRAIVPPKRWVIREAALKQRWLQPRWNGLDPSGTFGRVPFVRKDQSPVEPDGAPFAHVRRSLISPRLAWVVAALLVIGLLVLWTLQKLRK